MRSSLPYNISNYNWFSSGMFIFGFKMFFLLLEPLINHIPVAFPKIAMKFRITGIIGQVPENHYVQTMRSTVYKVFCIRQFFGNTSFYSWNFTWHGWTTIEALSSDSGQTNTPIPKIYQQTTRNGSGSVRFSSTNPQKSSVTWYIFWTLSL